MEEQATDTPAVFLSKLGNALKSRENIDLDLANLVSQHILTAAPDENCVEQALKTITALADARAVAETNSDG